MNEPGEAGDRPLEPDPSGEKTVPTDPRAPDRYRIIGPLTGGGMGDIFRAKDTLTGREVLLKQIKEHDDGPVDPVRLARALSRFRLETLAAAQLEHPNIVPLYDAGFHDKDRPYYVMRYIRGETLDDAVTRHHDPARSLGAAERTMELRGLLGSLLAVCAAVAYAHSRKVYHRDIKPKNILLGKYGETQLIDWGLAKLDSAGMGDDEPAADASLPCLAVGIHDLPASLPGEQGGTPAYMAPEQAAGNVNGIGPHTDVYGLGATLYHLLVGRAPIAVPKGLGRREALRRMLDDVIAGAYPRPRAVNPRVTPVLEAICLKAMAVEPADRYPSAKALAADLERTLADEPVAVCRDPWTVRFARFTRRHRVTMSAAGLLLATSIVGLSMGTVFAGRERDVARANAEREMALAKKAQLERDNAAMEAEKRREIAEVAREGIDTLVVGLQDSLWGEVPGTIEKRIELLERAKEAYQRFVDEQSTESSVVIGAMKIDYSLGVLYDAVGREDDCRRSFEAALATGRRFVETDPNDHQTVSFLAVTAYEWAEVLRIASGPEAARPVFDEALQRGRDAARLDPTLGRGTAALTGFVHALNRWHTGAGVEAFRAMIDACDEIANTAVEHPDQRLVLERNAIFNRALAVKVALQAGLVDEALGLARANEADSRRTMGPGGGGDGLLTRAAALLALARAENAAGSDPRECFQRADAAVDAARLAIEAGAHGAAAGTLLAEALATRADTVGGPADDRRADLEKAIDVVGAEAGLLSRLTYGTAAILGDLHARLATLHAAQRRDGEARTAARDALRLLEPLEASDPRDPDLARPLAAARAILSTEPDGPASP